MVTVQWCRKYSMCCLNYNTVHLHTMYKHEYEAVLDYNCLTLTLAA